ncbi:MAG: hypothetical protein ABR540_01420 [Acidimicrobiales bacterium]
MARDDESARPAPDIIEAGIPATTETPSGVPEGWEADEEPPPLDFPQGAESWGTTGQEQQLGESLRLRVLREEAEVGEPAAGDGVRLLEPGAEDGLLDDEADAVGEVDLAGGDTPSPEEAAMRIEDEPAGLTYDRGPGYLDEE